MNITSLAPLAVVLPILGAALTFLLIRHPRVQRAVSIAVLTLTLLLECWLLASVWDGGTAGGEHRRLAAAAGASCWWWTSSPPSCSWCPRP